MGEGESSRLNVPRRGGEPWQGSLGKTPWVVSLEPDLVAKMDKEMSQVGKTGGKGTGGKGDSLEARVKAMPLGGKWGPTGDGAGLGEKGLWRPSQGPNDTEAPRQPAGEQKRPGKRGRRSQSSRWHRGDCSTAGARGEEGVGQPS